MLLEIRDEMRRMREDVSALVAQQKQVADQQEHLLARLDALSSASISAGGNEESTPTAQHSALFKHSAIFKQCWDARSIFRRLTQARPSHVRDSGEHNPCALFPAFRSHEELKGAGHLVEISGLDGGKRALC